MVAFTSNQVYVCSYKKKRVISLRIETSSRKFNKKACVCAIGIYRQFKYFKAISGLQNIIKKDRVSDCCFSKYFDENDDHVRIVLDQHACLIFFIVLLTETTVRG